jgi:putative thioredoxin
LTDLVTDSMDVTESSFQAAVIDRSHQVPVVVDFWASWCAPCRQLGPLLERAALARSGKVDLVKLDVDANPNLSRSFGIQGIPAVKAFRDGRVVAEFVGAQPSPMVERFFDSLLPSEAELLAQRGDEESLRQAVELDPTRAEAAVPLARIHLDRGEPEAALQLLENVHGSFVADGLAARIRLQREVPTPDLSAAFAELDAGDYERALDTLIDLLRRAREARDEIRRVIVGVLDELGADHPLTNPSRAKLAAALY